MIDAGDREEPHVRPIRTTSDFALAVREARLAMGATQSELAERAGVSRVWLSRLETGTTSGSLAMVLRLLAALDMSITMSPIVRPDDHIDLDALLADG